MKKIKIMLMLLSALTLVGCVEKAENLNENKSVKISEKRYDRFIVKKVDNYRQIWVDKETGVNYLFFESELSKPALTVMYDKNGKVLISDTNKEK